MNKLKFNKFIKFIQKDNLVYAPKRIDGRLVISEIDNPKDIELSSEMPLYSFKPYLIPPQEEIYGYKNNKIKTNLKIKPSIIFGLTIPDLKALTMQDQVFAHDPYFQERIKKTIIIGHSLVPDKNYQFFIEKFSEDILEHLKFDIFLAVQRFSYKIYTGSEDGQRLLDRFGDKNYEHIEYVGPIREEGPDQTMLKIKQAMEENPNHPIWEELGKICIECGKCTIVCPTCFCFDLIDQAGLKKNSGQKLRCWDTCFYTDFSKVAGPDDDKPRFLRNTKDRIRFWYEHKFVRIPHEYSIMGCVGCGRCTKVCPAGIDIKKNLQKIIKFKKL